MPFGKCKGESLQDIYRFNPKYLEWLTKYIDNFSINLNDFSILPTPTPYIVEEKGELNILWIQKHANFVEKAKSFLRSGGLIPEKEFNFSKITLDILKQKKAGIYKAPPFDKECA